MLANAKYVYVCILLMTAAACGTDPSSSDIPAGDARERRSDDKKNDQKSLAPGKKDGAIPPPNTVVPVPSGNQGASGQGGTTSPANSNPTAPDNKAPENTQPKAPDESSFSQRLNRLIEKNTAFANLFRDGSLSLLNALQDTQKYLAQAQSINQSLDRSSDANERSILKVRIMLMLSQTRSALSRVFTVGLSEGRWSQSVSAAYEDITSQLDSLSDEASIN